MDGGAVNVEYYRDIRPIFERSCVACHTHTADKPAGGLVLDDDHLGMQGAFGEDAVREVPVPQTYFRLAAWKRYTPAPAGAMVTPGAASPYITKFQSRRSLLAWKIFGRRLDGYSNDDLPSITKIGDFTSLRGPGNKLIEKLDYSDEKALAIYARDANVDRDYAGSQMPPEGAVKSGKVKPLSDEDRRTIVRWIDLGCPIDLDPRYDPKQSNSPSYGWLGDDQRPTLALTYPAAGANKTLDRILVGMTDAYKGLDMASFQVTADFEVDGAPAGENLAEKFTPLADSRWELRLKRPINDLAKGKLTVSVRDRQGNTSRIERTFTVDPR